jgi:hypothetical protein
MRARQRHLKPKSIGAFIALDSRYINQGDNTAISTWSDLSGSSNDATQATGSFQPVYRTGILGGNGVVRFDGTNDFLEPPTITKSQPYTSFAITYPKQYKASGYNAFFEDSSLGCFTGISPDSGISKHTIFAGASLFGPASTLNAWFLGSYVVNSTSSKITINGGAPTTGNAGSTNINGKFQLGRNWDQNSRFYWDNDTALAMVCEGAFSDSLRKRVEQSAAYSFKIACS